MSNTETLIHLCAGGVGGTMGAVVTCPLEVVKTRLQSSSMLCQRNVVMTAAEGATSSAGRTLPFLVLGHCPVNSQIPAFQWSSSTYVSSTWSSHSNSTTAEGLPKGTLSCFRHLIEQEGCRALFKGLGANLVGVAPTRALYFCTYSTAKRKFNQIMTPDSHWVHMCSAGSAGFVACTLTNPIWFVKTRLQLNRSQTKVSTWQCIAKIYERQGPLGFYKGISASYFGISETIINFVLYEYLKSVLLRWRQTDSESSVPNHPIDFMMAGAISKTVACCLAYPHEVARTRLREENSRYRGFFQTLNQVFRDEGHRGLYRGLGTQLVRQIPNMAIMMTTYEATVYLLNSLVGDDRDGSD